MSPLVTRIEIEAQIDPESGSLRETARVGVTGTDVSLLVFTLDEGLAVERCQASEGFVECRKGGHQLRVEMDPPLSGSRVLTFSIAGRVSRGRTPLIGNDRAVLGPADGWYPVFPGTWAAADIEVTLPENWSALAPGRRDAAAPEGVWRWRSKTPLRGLGLVAGRGLVLTEAMAIGTPVRLLAPLGGPKASDVARRIADPLAWLSGALTPYPFDGFNLAILPGLEARVRASGMVVVSSTFPVDTPSDGADLMAGQWWGEILAGDGAWMEAFAAWQATAYARDRAAPLPNEIARLRSAYLGIGSSDIALSKAGHDARPEVLRGKGSAAPDVLRLIVGDREWFRGVRDLFEAPIGPPMRLSELRGVFERRAGRSLARPFAEWFERPGIPEFGAILRTMPAVEGGWRVDLTLLQNRGSFGLAVPVVFRGPGQEHRETIEVEGERTAVFYVLPFEPTLVEIDPLGTLYMVRTPPVRAVRP